jgi:nicotinate-nucleotide adenylyltransferase
MSTRPIALFGGTFDPIHNGHLRAAWEAAERLDADVHMVPSHVPPHRPPTRASATQRLELLRVAIAGQQRLRIDDRELRREGPSYTLDTLLELRAEIGPARPLVLLLGEDAFAGLPGWSRWEQLITLAHIGVLTRPGPARDWPVAIQDLIRTCSTDAAQDLSTSAHGRVMLLSIPPLDISSTYIRQLLAQGREPRYLVPDALLDQGLLQSVYCAPVR